VVSYLLTLDRWGTDFKPGIPLAVRGGSSIAKMCMANW